MKTRSLKSILSSLLVAIMVISFISSPLATLHHIPHLAGFVLVAGMFIVADKVFARFSVGGKFTMLTPTDSLNLATLASELNAYYREHYDYIWQELLLRVFGEDGYGLGRNFTFLPGIVDQLALDSVTVSSFIHQYNPTAAATFNPVANAITPAARILQVKPYEGDLQFKEKEIKTSELMWQKGMKRIALMGIAGQTQSFIESLFWDKIIKRAERDLRQAILQAVYNPTASAGLLNICDGFEQVITAEIGLGNITPFSMGTITKLNSVESIEAVFDTLDTAVQKADDLIVALRSDVFKMWGRGNRFALGREWNFDSATSMSLDMYSNAKIIEEPDMVLNKCVIYRKSEAFVGIDEGSLGDWRFQSIDRLLKMMLDGEVGFQFSMVNPGGQINMAVGQ